MPGPPDPDAASSRPAPAAAGGGPSLRRIGRRHAPWIALIWLLACAAAIYVGAPRLRLRAGTAGLLPEAHRLAPDRGWLLLRTTGAGTPEDLSAALAALARELEDARLPIAPPRGALRSWFDRHALAFIPIEGHEELARRLSDEAIARAADRLMAWLASPLFAVMGREPRRDPLELADLRARPLPVAGRWPELERASATGDLLGPEGRTALVAVRLAEPRRALELEARARAAVEGWPVDATLLGPAATDAHVERRLRERWPRLLALAATAWTLILALAFRRARPVLAIVGCLSLTGLALASWLPEVDLLTLPLLLLAVGFASEGALHLTRLSTRGWPAAAILATALSPLTLSAYPTWIRLAPVWLVVVGALVLALRLVLPALLHLLRTDVAWSSPGVRVQPMPALAVLLSAALLAAGGWAARRARYHGADDLPLALPELSTARDLQAGDFFDPRRLARVASPGATPAAALERAAADSRVLADLIPRVADALTSPGLLVLPEAEARRRQAALAALDLPQRAGALRQTLKARGFRPDAFGEFLRTVATPADLPVAEAALDSALGPWIEAHATADPPAVDTTFLLPPDPSVVPNDVIMPDGSTLAMRGPPVAVRRDRRHFQDWLGILSVAQIWLSALFVWLGTRRLTVALAAALAGLTTQSAVILVLVILGLPLGPHLIPALLLVGAAAVIAATRSCRARLLGRPVPPAAPLVTGATQIGAGLALLASGEPLWAQMGAVVAVGAALAWGVGLFLAPGMHALILRLRRRTRT